jgi:hypothetical protein
MILHFNPFQPLEPENLPHPTFDNDLASIQPDDSPPDRPERKVLDTATTPDVPYS